MTFDEYQEKAYQYSQDTAWGNSSDTVTYPVVGLANEAGELLGKLKKIYRDNDGYLEDGRHVMAKELCDCLWYVSEIATQLGYDLSAIAQINIDKLGDRHRRGVIGGSGDER